MCACNPENGITCLYHFDLDAHILREGLKQPAPANGTADEPCCDGNAIGTRHNVVCENYIDEADGRETFETLEDLEGK